MLIELAGVNKRYDSVHALRDVTAAIDGRVIGLLGPNGAGKSTLLKCMLGLTTHEGRATILGLPSSTRSLEIRDRVGYMPEVDSYLSGMTAVELCLFAAELSGLPRIEAMQRAHSALYYAGLEDKRYLKVEGYSTGLKQRVKLAQALVHDPELLFLDEPTNGLDPRARDEMLELIAELPEKRGCAIILSTHLLPDVDRISDHVVIMHQGQIRYAGTIDELRRGGRGEDEGLLEVEVKLDPRPFADRLVQAGCRVEFAPPRSLSVRLPPGETSRMLLSEARAIGAQVRHIKIKVDSLETAFMRVVEGPA